MPRPLKVYGWKGMRSEARTPRNPYDAQTREIVAAHSAAEVARIADVPRPDHLFNLSETGNAFEIKLAMTFPGQILWRPLDVFSAQWVNASTGAKLPLMLEQEPPQENIRNALGLLRAAWQSGGLEQADVDAITARLTTAVEQLERNQR